MRTSDSRIRRRSNAFGHCVTGCSRDLAAHVDWPHQWRNACHNSRGRKSTQTAEITSETSALRHATQVSSCNGANKTRRAPRNRSRRVKHTHTLWNVRETEGRSMARRKRPERVFSALLRIRHACRTSHSHCLRRTTRILGSTQVASNGFARWRSPRTDAWSKAGLMMVRSSFLSVSSLHS